LDGFKGNDNSTVRQDYSYDDKTAQPNIRYYYRLKQIDNGNVAFEYSKIVTAQIISEGKTAIGDFIPNPARDKASIDLFIGKDQTVVIDVYEVTGKFIKSEKLEMKKGFNTYFIQTEDLSAATYVVSFKMDDQRISKRLNVLR
jgi:Zn-dependent metalloprotease